MTTVNTTARHSAARIGGRTLIEPAHLVVARVAGNDVAYAPGIAAPVDLPVSAEGDAGDLSGEYRYRVSYVDDAFGSSETESNLSPASIALTVASKKIDLDLSDIQADKPARCTILRVYRTLAGGSDYYPLTDLDSSLTSYEDNLSDASIFVAGTAATDDRTPPDAADGAFQAGARVGLWRVDGTVEFSHAGNPEHFNPLEVVQVQPDGFSELVAVVPFGDFHMCYFERELHLAVFGDNPLQDAGANLVDSQRGALNQRCIVDLGNQHLVLDRQGIYAYRGGRTIINIDTKIRQLLKRMNTSYASRFNAAADGDRVVFWLVLDDESEPRHGVQLDLQKYLAGAGEFWEPLSSDHGIRESLSWGFGSDAGVAGLHGHDVMTLWDSNGRGFYWGGGVSDGVPYHLIDAGVTAAKSGAGPTTFTVTSPGGGRAFSVGGVTVVGCYVRFKVDGAWSDPYLITAVPFPTQFQVAEDLSAIANGTEFAIGGFQRLWTSPISDFGQGMSAKRAQAASLTYIPSPVSYEIDVSFDRDRKGFNVAADDLSYGAWSFSAGVAEQTLSLGDIAGGEAYRGYVSCPVGSDSFRTLQLVIEATGAGRPFELLAYSVELAASRRVKS